MALFQSEELTDHILSLSILPPILTPHKILHQLRKMSHCLFIYQPTLRGSRTAILHVCEGSLQSDRIRSACPLRSRISVGRYKTLK